MVVVEKVVPEVVVVVVPEIGHKEPLPSPVDDTFLDLHALRQSATIVAASNLSVQCVDLMMDALAPRPEPINLHS